MKLISRLLALLCGLALAAGLVSWVADAELLQPTAVITHIPTATYSQLAAKLPATLAKVTTVSADQQALLAQFINANLLRQFVDTVVTTELNYWHGKTGPPTIDLRPLADRLGLAQAAVSPQIETFLETPQPLANSHVDGGLRSLVRSVDRLRWLGLFIALVLAIVIWFTAGHRRFRCLAEALGVTALAIGGAIVVGLGVPALINSGLAASPIAPLAPPIHAALTALVRTSNHTLEKTAIGAVIVAAGLFVCSLFLGRHHD